MIIHVTKQEFKELKVKYEKCTGESFYFKGHEVLKDYAKYLIQFLETHNQQGGGTK